MSNNRYVMPWSLADEATAPAETVEVIDLTGATHEIRTDARCPACQGDRIDTAVTPAGDRYDRCLDCDRLWEVDGAKLRLVVAHSHRHP